MKATAFNGSPRTSGNTSLLIDRCGMVVRAKGKMPKRKAGAAVVAVRRAAATNVFDTIDHFFTIGQMIIPGSKYWNVGVGRNIGEVEQDQEGVATMKVLGQNMAWLLKTIAEEESGAGIPRPGCNP